MWESEDDDLYDDIRHWESATPYEEDPYDELTSRIHNHDITSESDTEQRQEFSEDVREKLQEKKEQIFHRSEEREEQRNFEDAQDQQSLEKIDSIEEIMSQNFGEHWEP